MRAFDVHSGKLLWTFNTIPRPGEFGNDTWENGSWATNGNTGVWTQMTVDEDLGLVYLPVETPTSDFYGGHRPGNNLFAESLVCVDLKTGKRKWHFQIVHHPIWDYDLSSAPILADINVDGKAIKAVALPSKEAFLYVFDRVTGEPVWPIEERPVPQSDVPGEKTSPTQPFPTKPPAYGAQLRQGAGRPDRFHAGNASAGEGQCGALQDRSDVPAAHRRRSQGLIGSMTLGTASGGTNWPGAGYDPETHIVYAQANQSALFPISMRTPPDGFSDIRYVMGRNDTEFRVSEGPGFGSAADAPQQPRAAPAKPAPAKPAAAPAAPGGRSHRARSLDREAALRGDLGDQSGSRRSQWQVPYGETPDVVRNHPALKGMNIGNTGQPGSVGLVVTKTLVILGDSQITTTPSASARRDAARVRQGHRQRSRRGADARSAKRLAHDLHGGWQAVHRGRRQRRSLLGRVHCLQPAVE